MVERGPMVIPAPATSRATPKGRDIAPSSPAWVRVRGRTGVGVEDWVWVWARVWVWVGLGLESGLR